MTFDEMRLAVHAELGWQVAAEDRTQIRLVVDLRERARDLARRRAASIDAHDDVATEGGHGGDELDELEPVPRVVLDVEDRLVVEVERLALSRDELKKSCLRDPPIRRY